MKKYLQYANYFVAATGVMGAFLLKSLLRAGTDHKGIYPSAHPSWIGYLLLSAATIAILWLATRGEENDPTWQRNHPKTPLQKVLFSAGYVLCAAAIGLYGKNIQPITLLDKAAYWGSFTALAALAVLAVQYFAGKTPTAFLHLIPCLYMAVLLFLLSKANSAETELLRFLPQMFALAASALASYQLWGFAVGCGDREKSLFWSLSACHLCLAAAGGGNVLFTGLALWHLLSHPVLVLPPVEEEIIETEEPEENL